jgi:hypothetical protein
LAGAWRRPALIGVIGLVLLLGGERAAAVLGERWRQFCQQQFGVGLKFDDCGGEVAPGAVFVVDLYGHDACVETVDGLAPSLGRFLHRRRSDQACGFSAKPRLAARGSF